MLGVGVAETLNRCSNTRFTATHAAGSKTTPPIIPPPVVGARGVSPPPPTELKHVNNSADRQTGASRVTLLRFFCYLLPKEDKKGQKDTEKVSGSSPEAAPPPSTQERGQGLRGGGGSEGNKAERDPITCTETDRRGGGVHSSLPREGRGTRGGTGARAAASRSRRAADSRSWPWS